METSPWLAPIRGPHQWECSPTRQWVWRRPGRPAGSLAGKDVTAGNVAGQLDAIGVNATTA